MKKVWPGQAERRPAISISSQIFVAPGAPGIAPTWTSSAKDVVGCGLGPSRIWFTVGFGVVNEVYFPRADLPQIRDLGFIVADDKGFWVEVKRLQNYTIRALAPGVPAVEVVHTHERFKLTLTITPDPDRDCLAVGVYLTGDLDLRVYVLLAPHLGATGCDNVAVVTHAGARRVLGATQGPFGLALAVVDDHQRDGLGEASAGYVGVSDTWQDFDRNGGLTWRYDTAGPGNVALGAAIPRQSVIALAFGGGVHAAATLAISTLMQPLDMLIERQIETWSAWHDERQKSAMLDIDPDDPLGRQFLLSSMVLRAHRDKTYSGAMVASLSVPWGNSRNDRGGYHLIWPRDLVECALALLGLGARRDSRDTLRYLIATQKADGAWNQNQWLGGSSYWDGVQLDEAAFPVLLASALAERDALRHIEVADMVTRAVGFIARTGPCSDQDRWEENAGLNAFTLAAAIAALVAGAELLPDPAKRFLLTLADFWNANLERWMVVKDTPLARRIGVDGYYVRIAPQGALADPSALSGSMQVKNRADGGVMPISEVVGTDFLQLVRFGLRRPDDPWILQSLKVVDALLKVDTPNGPAWRRYVGDGYGEHEDGSPFDGSGIGRAWPLLTGERGHYEVVAGRDPEPYLRAMAAMTGPSGMLPEQVWDTDPIPSRGLYPGRPSGSAMPLAWTHAEFIKLMISRKDKEPIDRPRAAWQRYGGARPAAITAVWSDRAPIGTIEPGQSLMLALPRPATAHWGLDGWNRVTETTSTDTELGVHVVELDAAALAGAKAIDFTFRWEDGSWAGVDRRIEVARA